MKLNLYKIGADTFTIHAGSAITYASALTGIPRYQAIKAVRAIPKNGSAEFGNLTISRFSDEGEHILLIDKKGRAKPFRKLCEAISWLQSRGIKANDLMLVQAYFFDEVIGGKFEIDLEA